MQSAATTASRDSTTGASRISSSGGATEDEGEEYLMSPPRRLSSASRFASGEEASRRLGGKYNTNTAERSQRRGFCSRLGRVFFVLVCAAVLLWLALGFDAALYVAVYWCFVPWPVHEADLFFDFDQRTGGASVENALAHAHGADWRPTAVVPLGLGAKQWVKGDGDAAIRIAYEYPLPRPTGSRRLYSGQSYDVFVEMSLAESGANMALGTFMITTELIASDGITLALSKRPASLRYASPLTLAFKDALFALPRALGLFHPSSRQVIRMHALEGYVESSIAEEAVAGIRVTVSTEQLHLYDAKMTLLCDMSGIRYFMYHWRLATAICFVSICASWQFCFGAAAYLYFLRRDSPLDAKKRSDYYDRDTDSSSTDGDDLSFPPTPNASEMFFSNADDGDNAVGCSRGGETAASSLSEYHYQTEEEGTISKKSAVFSAPDDDDDDENDSNGGPATSSSVQSRAARDVSSSSISSSHNLFSSDDDEGLRLRRSAGLRAWYENT